MHVWQIERQLAKLLADATWGDAPNAVVLTGGVAVSPDGIGPYLPPGGPNGLGTPFALVSVERETAEPEIPGLGEARLQARVVAGSRVNDAHGVQSVVGGTRDPVQGQGKSTGRGLDEITQRLVDGAMAGGKLVESSHAIQGRVSSVGPVVQADGNEILYRAIEVTARSLATRHYHPVYKLKATGGVAKVDLAWSLPATRWDTFSLVLRRSVAGGAVPASPTDGVGVAVAVTDTTKTVDGLAAGVYQFALWVAYDETASGTAERYSAAATAAGTAT